MRIAIIGLGWVGTSIASNVLHLGIARELLLHDIKPGLAEGEAMDLAQGAAFYPAARVRAADLDEISRTNAVVIAAGRGGTAGESRLQLLQDNAAIARDIGQRLQGYSGLVVVVTNPVDVLTQVVTEASGLPPSRVIGTGTLLDTARLRHLLGSELNLDPRSVHAQVIGEHGDSEVVLWSSAHVGGRLLRDWPDFDRSREPDLAEQVRRAAYEIISRKGATNHAIGVVTAHLLKWALHGSNRILNVSRVQEGAAGIDGVALSLPAVVGEQGILQVIEPTLNDAEREGLHASAETLRQAYREVAAEE